MIVENYTLTIILIFGGYIQLLTFINIILGLLSFMEMSSGNEHYICYFNLYLIRHSSLIEIKICFAREK